MIGDACQQPVPAIDDRVCWCQRALCPQCVQKHVPGCESGSQKKRVSELDTKGSEEFQSSPTSIGGRYGYVRGEVYLDTESRWRERERTFSQGAPLSGSSWIGGWPPPATLLVLFFLATRPGDQSSSSMGEVSASCFV